MYLWNQEAPNRNPRGRSASGDSDDNLKGTLTDKLDKHKAVLRLALIYLASMASVTGITSVSNFLYDQIGLYNLGQLGNFLCYAGMFIGTFFTRSIMGWFKDLRSAMYFGLIMIGLPMLAIVWTYGCSERSDPNDPHLFCKKVFLRSINLTANFAMGLLGQAVIWATEYEYIDRLTNLAEKKSYFALFYSVMQFHGVISALLNYGLYSYNIDSLYCFIGFYSVHCLATISVAYYLPEISHYKSEPCPEFSLMDYEAEANMVLKHKPEDRLVSAADTVKGFFDTLYNSSKLMRFIPYMVQSGLFQGLVAGVLYRIVEIAYTDDTLDIGKLTPHEKDQEESRIKTQICLVNIFFYLCGLAACRMVLKLNHRKRNWAMRFVSVLLSVIAVSYWADEDELGGDWTFPVIMGSLGIIHVMLNQVPTTYISESCPKTIEAFAVFKQIQTLGAAIYLAFYLVASEANFLRVQAALQVVSTVMFLIIFRG